MSGTSRSSVRLFDVVNGEEVVSHGTVARLATIAILRSRLVVSLMNETVIPSLPPARRAATRMLAKRIERDDLFDEALLADIEALGDRLEGIVSAGTYVDWEPTDGHVRGGSEVVRQAPGIANLAVALEEVQLLHEALVATLSAARAVREAEQLIAI